MVMKAKTDPPNDPELVARSQAGDPAAFEQLVKRYQQKVFGIAYGIVRNREEACDVTQDTFIRAFRHLKKFKGASSFYTWLYRITVNLSLDAVSRQSRHRMVDIDLVEQTDPEFQESWNGRGGRSQCPEKQLEIKELADAVAQALDKLSEKHRTVIVLRELEGLSYEEIAQVVECNLGTVMSRLFHARGNMKKIMSRMLDANRR